jgi:excisionase family DNA binding protein
VLSFVYAQYLNIDKFGRRGSMMMETRHDDRFLTIQEVAERLHVCRASIYLWLRQGFPQPVKFGRASRWSSLELEEWVRKRPKGVYGEQTNE